MAELTITNKVSSLSEKVRTILLFDPVRGSRLTTKWFLSSLGFEVHAAGTAEGALSAFDANVHDVIVLQNGGNGPADSGLAAALKRRNANTPVIAFGGEPISATECIDHIVDQPHLLALKETLDSIAPHPLPRR